MKFVIDNCQREFNYIELAYGKLHQIFETQCENFKFLLVIFDFYHKYLLLFHNKVIRFNSL